MELRVVHVTNGKYNPERAVVYFVVNEDNTSFEWRVPYDFERDFINLFYSQDKLMVNQVSFI